MTDPILFILAVLTLLGTPGPTNTLLATSGATVGVKWSLMLLAGELSGYLIAILAIRIVLGPIIHAYPLVGIALKIAVVAYLGIKLTRPPLWLVVVLLLGGYLIADSFIAPAVDSIAK